MSIKMSEKANNTINLRSKTKERLMALKLVPRESFDDVINRLIEKSYTIYKG